jgi:formate hydrogenlyase transcriptional activator
MTESTTESRYQALLTVAEHLATHLCVEDLVSALHSALQPLIAFDFLAVSTYDPSNRTLKLRVLSSNVRMPVGHPEPWKDSETPAGVGKATGSHLYVTEVATDNRYPAFHEMLLANGIHSYCFVPLISAGQFLGGLNFGSSHPKAYSADDVEFMRAVGRQVSVSVDNAASHDRVEQERDRLQLLLEVNNAVVSHLDERSLMAAVSSKLRERLGADLLSLTMPDASNTIMERRILDFPSSSGLIREGESVAMEDSPATQAFRTGRPRVINGSELESHPCPTSHILWDEGIRSICAIPLRSRQQVIGTLNIGSRVDGHFKESDLPWLDQVAGQVAIALDNAGSYRRIEELNARLANEKLYLEDEIRSTSQFEEIIGESPAIQGIFRDLETVAPTDSTVLIAGETGTGKELLARAIHDLSPRKSRTFVKLNCAAIPTGLLESELFGHERGAFTGAIAQRIGRFELAHGGTIFLDEIGEIPLELQPKLLRVLQEREFERLGSSRTLRVNARLVAATNRDLAKMVEQGQFRADLFYRLNVFPLHVPPLRERREDIPLLVRFFVRQFSRGMNRTIETIPTETMDALVRYSWPGNIRELQNLMERAVILSSGTVLRVPLGELKAAATDDHSPAGVTTLEAAERSAILRALKDSNGKVGGDAGAASKLGMKRTTLQAKMRKLGIDTKSTAQ